MTAFYRVYDGHHCLWTAIRKNICAPPKSRAFAWVNAVVATYPCRRVVLFSQESETAREGYQPLLPWWAGLQYLAACWKWYPHVISNQGRSRHGWKSDIFFLLTLFGPTGHTKASDPNGRSSCRFSAQTSLIINFNAAVTAENWPSKANPALAV